MTLASTKLVPELHFWVERFVRDSAVNKNQIPAPVTFDEIYMPQRSFIEMLFNEDYSYTTYEYLYIEAPSRTCFPQEALNRLMLYPQSGKYMKLNLEGTNDFLLQPHDFIMLDALLSYRQDSTGLIIIDTTGTIEYILDSTGVDILEVDYDALLTPLSKLIYLFLDLKIRGNTELYDTTTLISTGRLLDAWYEAYVLDEVFKTISSRGI